MTPSKILFFSCLSFVAGIFLESSFGIARDEIIKIPQLFVLGILILCIFIIFTSIVCVCLFQSSQELWNKFLIGGFCVLFLVLGILRFQISEFNIANDKLSKLNGKGQIVLTGIISNEPDVRDASQKIKVHPVKFAFSDASPEAKQFNGVKISDSTILVTTDRYPEYKYLDKIKLIGELEVPLVYDDFNYKNYLLPPAYLFCNEFSKNRISIRKTSV